MANGPDQTEGSGEPKTPEPSPRRLTPSAGSSMGGRVLGGIAWTLSGTLAQAVLQLLSIMVLARLLTPEIFGLVAAALVVIKIAQFFTNLGLSGAIIQRPELEDRHIETAFAVLIWFGLLMWLLVELAAPWIAKFYRNDDIERIVRLLAFALLFSNAMEVANGLMRRDLEFKLVAFFQVIAFAVGYGLVGIGLALLDFGVWALASAHVAQTFTNMVLMLRHRPHPKTLIIRWTPLKELLRFGTGMMAWRTASNVALEADNLVVGRFLGAAELGFYSRAYWLAATPAVLVGRGVAGVLFSSLARLQHDQKRLAEAYRRGVTVNNLIAVPASVGIAILAPELVAVVLGPQWGPSVPPLQILALGLLFRMSVRVSDSLTGAAGAVYRTATIQWIYAASVALGAYLGQFWGVEGVAFGILGALVLNYALMTGLALRITALPVSSLPATFGPGIRTTLVLGPVLYALERACDNLGAPALLTLLTVLAAAGVIVLILIRLAPRTFIGDDGIWVLHLVIKRLPKRLRRNVRLVLPPDERPTDGDDPQTT